MNHPNMNSPEFPQSGPPGSVVNNLNTSKSSSFARGLVLAGVGFAGGILIQVDIDKVTNRVQSLLESNDGGKNLQARNKELALLDQIKRNPGATLSYFKDGTYKIVLPSKPIPQKATNAMPLGGKTLPPLRNNTLPTPKSADSDNFIFRGNEKPHTRVDEKPHAGVEDMSTLSDKSSGKVQDEKTYEQYRQSLPKELSDNMPSFEYIKKVLKLDDGADLRFIQGKNAEVWIYGKIQENPGGQLYRLRLGVISTTSKSMDSGFMNRLFYRIEN